VTLTLGSAPGAALSGTLVLTFASTATANAGADNMEVRFSDSTRMVSFTVNADGTVTLPAGLAIITGTVEGKGTIVANFLDPLNLTGTPLASTTVNFTVSAAVPVITSFTIACSGTTYTATVVGYSTTLDMTSVTFTFTPTSGTNLATPSVTVQNSVPQAFAAWWSSSQAATTGSQFTLAVQLTFMVTGGASTNPIVAATAAMTNSQGSTPTPLPSAVPTPACS